jgi:uncharacterized protein with HEPN domain
MSSNRDTESLIDIDFYARQTLSFTTNFTKDAFEKDEKTQAAVMYAIAIMGEAKRDCQKSFDYNILPFLGLKFLASAIAHLKGKFRICIVIL